jgi:HlyD family secretion protein
LTGVVVGLGLAAVLASLFTPRGWRSASAQSPRTESARTEIHALARLEPASGLITVGARPGARVDVVHVKSGDEVKAGQLLFELEGHDAAKLQLAVAEAQKRRADEEKGRQRDRLAIERRREDRVQKGRLQALESIHSTLDARAKEGEKTLPLVEKLPGVTVKDRADFSVGLDRIKVEASRARIELEQARADQEALGPLRVLQDKGLADGGAADELLQRQVELARANLELTTVKAPSDGRVLDVTALPGEVSSGPLLLLGDVTAMAATAEVDQSDIPAIKPGATAEITLLGQKVAGTVTKVGRTVGKNLLASPDPRMPQDLRVVKVTIQLDSPEPAADFVNMQVDAAIRPRPAGAK